MKILKYVFAGLAGLIVAIVLIAAGYSAYLRSADADYHAGLTKSLDVSSSDFRAGQEMAVEYSCTDGGLSPHIRWTGAPNGTRSFALVATDWDAPSPNVKLLAVTHWVLYNIPSRLSEIPHNASSDELEKTGISVGLNIGGEEAYTAPCPPFGTHQYFFRVYALDSDTIEPASKSRSAVMEAMRGHVLAYGELIGHRSAG